MNKTSSRAAAAALSLAIAGIAQAVPVYFDFTGTITPTFFSGVEGAEEGMRVSGGFTFDTEQLAERTVVPASFARSWESWSAVNSAEPWAHLDFGSRSIEFPAGPGPNGIATTFTHGCTPDECTPGYVEYFSIYAASLDRDVPLDFTGTYSLSVLTFDSHAWHPHDSSTAFDYFDLAAVDPGSIITLPLHELRASYVEITTTCISGLCDSSGFREVPISIDSVTRGIGTRSVPEPGTLGLLGVGLLAALATRRHRALAPHQQQA